MKGLILFTAITYLLIAIPDTHAGIASVITYLQGECNEPDEHQVRMCSSRENGEIYYVYKGERYKTYPLK